MSYTITNLELMEDLLKEANKDPRFRQTMADIAKVRKRKDFIKALKKL